MAQVAALSVLLSDFLLQTRLADIEHDVCELPSAEKGGSQEVLATALPQTDRAGMDRGLATPEVVTGPTRLHRHASPHAHSIPSKSHQDTACPYGSHAVSRLAGATGQLSTPLGCHGARQETSRERSIVVSLIPICPAA